MGIAQLVESLPSKQTVAGSSPVSHSKLPDGEMVTHRTLTPTFVGSNPALAAIIGE